MGLENYRTLWHDTFFRDAVVETVKFTLITVSFEFVLGLIIALVVNSNFKGRGLMRAVMLVPWAIPTVVAAKMWQWMLDDTYGVINDLGVRLHILSHSRAWISDPSTALGAVCAVDIWKTTPFVALLLLAGLQVIPNDLYEAAAVDGASKLQQFWRITLPLLRPAILVALIFRTLDALRVFDVFFVFFGNRPDTQTMAIYAQSTIVDDGHVGYGAAVERRHLPDHLPVRGHLRHVPAGDGGLSTAAEATRTGARPVSRGHWLRRNPFGRFLVKLPFWLLIAAIFVYALFPFYWALRSAFMPETQLFDTPIQYWPARSDAAELQGRAQVGLLPEGAAQLDNRGGLGNADLARDRLAGGLRAGPVPLPWPVRVMYLMLSMTIFPQIAILGALYTMISNFHLYDTLAALILSYLIFTLPFTVWVLTASCARSRATSRRPHTSTARLRSRFSTRCCCR